MSGYGRILVGVSPGFLIEAGSILGRIGRQPRASSSPARVVALLRGFGYLRSRVPPPWPCQPARDRMAEEGIDTSLRIAAWSMLEEATADLRYSE